MKIIFAGPSLYASSVNLYDIELAPPVEHGDVTRAVLRGCNVIGIVDGHFEAQAAVWHKEILYALSLGVRILGSSSMGALRAAECADFGMVAIGEIARRYLKGDFVDDAAVAQTNGPAEMRFRPLTEPMVNVEASLHNLRRHDAITGAEHIQMSSAAQSVFYKDRTVRAIIAAAFPIDKRRAKEVEHAYQKHAVNLKASDAEKLVRAVLQAPNNRKSRPQDWSFLATSDWELAFENIRREAGITAA